MRPNSIPTYSLEVGRRHLTTVSSCFAIFSFEKKVFKKAVHEYADIHGKIFSRIFNSLLKSLEMRLRRWKNRIPLKILLFLNMDMNSTSKYINVVDMVHSFLVVRSAAFLHAKKPWWRCSKISWKSLYGGEKFKHKIYYRWLPWSILLALVKYTKGF